MTIDINRARAIELLKEAVAERGETYVYEVPNAGDIDQSCLYVDTEEGAPSCGVGLALNRAGVELTLLQKLDAPPCGTGIDSFEAADILYSAGFDISPDAYKVFGVFQDLQDKGVTWGQSLAQAESATL